MDNENVNNQEEPMNGAPEVTGNQENVNAENTGFQIPAQESEMAKESEMTQEQNVVPEQAAPEPTPNPEPQPMPSDNIYRFQQIEEEKPQQTYQKPEKNKQGASIGKTILCAVIFGVVAGACFFGLTKVTNVLGGGNLSISSVDTSSQQQNRTEIAAVSGGAVAVNDVSEIVENVMPSIVAITETSMVSSYFGQYPAQGAGSGIILKEDGESLLIVTNNHVVDGADSISVEFVDKSTAKATVKGKDSADDLAVISVKIKDLSEETKKAIKVASIGDSDALKVGQMAIAIGNALGYGQSVTVGYISAKDREVTVGENGKSKNTMTLLQTDAAINPGNSGGALIDANGNLIGINSVKYASTNVEGIGYAIPISSAIPIINDLMNREVLKDNEKGYLGISGRTIDESVSKAYGMPIGVYVSEVSDDGAAKDAGIKVGDIIKEIDGATIKTIEQVQNKVSSKKVGTEITVKIARAQEGEYKDQDIKVKLKGSKTLDGLTSGTTADDSKNSSNGGNGYGDSDSYGFGDDLFEDDTQILPW